MARVVACMAVKVKRLGKLDNLKVLSLHGNNIEKEEGGLLHEVGGLCEKLLVGAHEYTGEWYAQRLVLHQAAVFFLFLFFWLTKSTFIPLLASCLHRRDMYLMFSFL
eukprot:m.98939 g.98939  ORF g.98939 m.98939 type:complete len:107 (-) comp13132_c0_seq2:429-749(-)